MVVVVLQFPSDHKNFQETQSQLNRTAEELNMAATDLVGASRSTPNELSDASGNYGARFNELLGAGMSMAGQAKVMNITEIF